LKPPTFILIAVCTLFPGCVEDPIPDHEIQAYEAALDLQASGDYDGARDAWRSLKSSARDHRVRAKVELGLAQVETALIRRDRALERLQDAPALVDTVTLAVVEDEISKIAEEFRGTPFERIIEDRAVAARQAARLRTADSQTHEMQVVQALVDREEFAGALRQLRQIELNRNSPDNGDIVAALLSIRDHAEQAADRILDDFRQRQSDPAAALTWLDTQLPRFRGTRAYARLFAARLESIQSAPPTEPNSSLGDGL